MGLLHRRSAALLATLAAAPLLALTAARPAGGAGDEESGPRAAKALRIATIGASVTAGYGNARELRTDADVPLSTFLRTLTSERRPVEVTGRGDRWCFADAPKVGARQVDAALATSPTLVVAADFLFWYAYGRSTRRDPRREAGLEEGLRQLDRIGCPLVVGDLPDISSALDGKGPFGGPLVTRDLFPTDEQRTRMNERIRAWAERRGGVEIVPLSEITTRMRTGQTLVVRGNSWTVTDLGDALQDDRLHPTVRGSTWVAMECIDAATRFEGVEADDFDWDEEGAARRLEAATEPARRARAEKEQQRRERRERREKARDQRRDQTPDGGR